LPPAASSAYSKTHPHPSREGSQEIEGGRGDVSSSFFEGGRGDVFLPL